MPTCRECKLYDLAAVKNARGSVMSNRAARCLWKSSEQWPVSVMEGFNSRPHAALMRPNDVHRCPCFQKVGTP